MAFGLTLGCNASPYSVEKNRSCCTTPCCSNKTYKKISFFNVADISFSHSFSYIPRSNFVGAPGFENLMPRSIDYSMSLTGLAPLNGTWLQLVGDGFKNEGVNSCGLQETVDTEIDVELFIHALSTTYRYVSGTLQPTFYTQDVTLTASGRLFLGFGNWVRVVWQPGTMVLGDGSGAFSTFGWQLSTTGPNVANVGYMQVLGIGPGGVPTTSTLDLLSYHPAVCGQRIPGPVTMVQYASGAYYTSRVANVPGPIPAGASQFYLPPPAGSPYMQLQPNPSVFQVTPNGYVEVEYV